MCGRMALLLHSPDWSIPLSGPCGTIGSPAGCPCRGTCPTQPTARGVCEWLTQQKCSRSSPKEQEGDWAAENCQDWCPVRSLHLESQDAKMSLSLSGFYNFCFRVYWLTFESEYQPFTSLHFAGPSGWKWSSTKSLDLSFTSIIIFEEWEKSL